MANSTPVFPGKKSGGSDNRELYLDLYGGEVLNQYQTSTIMRPLQSMFSLAGGKSLRLPFIGQADASYHVPGTELTGGQVAGDEIILTPDDQLISDLFLSDIDEILAQFDARSNYAAEQGRALARKFDAASLRMLLKACRDAGKLGQGGGSVTEAAADTDPDKLFETFKAAIAVMDGKDVDVETQEIYGVVTKTNWYALQGCEKLRSRDYNPAANIATKPGTLNIDGVIVHKSSLGPLGVNDTTHPQAIYRVNGANTVGMVWTKKAIATAEVKAVWTDVDEQKSKRGALLMAGYMSGTRVFRATDAVEIKKA